MTIKRIAIQTKKNVGKKLFLVQIFFTAIMRNAYFDEFNESQADRERIDLYNKSKCNNKRKLVSRS